MSADLTQVEAAVMVAQAEAAKACREWLNQHGDRDACGFAWVNVWGVRNNSRLGKTLQSYGFRKSYDGSLQLWNPSGAATQSVSILEAGAEAYAKVLTEKLGIKAYAGSRLD
mgnify:CR=1 FL=1